MSGLHRPHLSVPSRRGRRFEVRRGVASRFGIVLASIVTLGACDGPSAPPSAEPPTATPTDDAFPASPPGTTDRGPAGSAPSDDAPAVTPLDAADTTWTPPDFSPLANLLSVSPGVLSGAMPRGDAGYSALVGLGVQVVVSVDAAPPDRERLDRFGLRSVHVPIRYATITPAEQAAVARAIAEAGGTVYVHSHRGRHRGPAAVASALRRLDRLTPEEAEAFLARAGTTREHPGLREAVRTAEPLTEAALQELAPELVARATPPAFAVAMAEADRHWDHLRLLAPRDWRPDPEHPDLVAAAEARILADLFRTMAEQVASRAYGSEVPTDLTRSAELAAALERHLSAESPDLPSARAAFDAIGASCRSCHRVHRDTE
jgi:hypothetical protein